MTPAHPVWAVALLLAGVSVADTITKHRAARARMDVYQRRSARRATGERE